MQQKLSIFEETGTQLLAISPMLPQISVELVKKLGLEFPVLSDQGNKVAKTYGLVFKLAESLNPIYNKFGIDVPSTNGDDSHQLPLPATYIVDSQQKIRYSFIDVDHTVRLDPEVIIREIAKI